MKTAFDPRNIKLYPPYLRTKRKGTHLAIVSFQKPNMNIRGEYGKTFFFSFWHVPVFFCFNLNLFFSRNRHGHNYKSR